MDYEAFRYDAPYRRPRSRVNYFGWTVAILLLIGIAFAAWLSTFYIFGQPERPQSYSILKKLRKVEQPKRFELTASPKGEFLDPKKVFDRYYSMGNAELAKANAELIRNYIRNYQSVRGLVPYVVGRYTVMDARPLGPADLVTSGMVALSTAVENGQVMMEHVYPSDPQDIPLMKETLAPGLEVRLERTHDISAIIHAEKLADGRLLITAMPLLYGTYTVTKGRGTFSLEPPLDLNLAAGWPIYKSARFKEAETRFADYRQHNTGGGGSVPIPGITPAGPAPAQNELVRVEQAVAVATPPPVAPAKPTPTPKGGKLAKGKKGAPSATPMTVAKASPPPAAMPSATPAQVAMASPPPRALPVAPPPSAAPQQQAPPPVAQTPAPVAPTLEAAGAALASTAGGGTWKTYAPGKMPVGRLIASSDIKEIADRGLAGERIYLKGQFTVNFADANRAVLRPKAGIAQSMLHPLGGGSNNSTRIIVEFPSGHPPPGQGSTVSRDEARPLEITEIRKQDDGQLNVFAREIIQP
jgi:hypothetical protein